MSLPLRIVQAAQQSRTMSSEAHNAPLLSTTQRALFNELKLSCETAAINGASIADISAACQLMNEHMICAAESAANEEATDALGIQRADYGDDDDDSEGWKKQKA